MGGAEQGGESVDAARELRGAWDTAEQHFANEAESLDAARAARAAWDTAEQHFADGAESLDAARAARGAWDTAEQHFANDAEALEAARKARAAWARSVAQQPGMEMDLLGRGGPGEARAELEPQDAFSRHREGAEAARRARDSWSRSSRERAGEALEAARSARSGQPGEVADPYGGHYFMLEVDGQEVAHILQVSGLRTNAQVFDLEEGGNNGFVHKRVGQSRWENLTIRYATSSSRYLQQWRDQFLRNPFGESLWRSGSICIFNNHGDPIRRFHFVRAWPVSWEGPRLDSGTSELAVESMELAHEGISVTDG